MQSLIYLSTTLFILGIFLIVKKSSKKMFWGGILSLLLSFFFIGYVFSGVWVDSNLIGIHFVSRNPQQAVMEMHYFDKKDAAFDFYQKKGIKEFMLVYKVNEDTQEFFDFFQIKKTPDGGKQLVFKGDPNNKHDPMSEVDKFFYHQELATVYNSLGQTTKKVGDKKQ